MPQLILPDDDGVIAMLRDSVAAFADAHPGPSTTRALRDADAGIAPDQWRAMGEAGWLGVLLPEALGGAGLGLRHQAVLSEALGGALVPSPIATASVLAGEFLAIGEDGAEGRRLAEGLVSGKRLVVPAITIDPRSTAPSLTIEAGDLVIDGSIDFVEAAASADDIIAVVREPQGHAIVSIPSTAAGLRRIDRPAVDGTRISSLLFTKVRVARGHVLVPADRSGAVERAVARAVDRTRLALAAELSGLASRTFEITAHYTRQRVQFGKPIASFQVIQHRLVDLWGEAEFAAAAVVNAIERQEESDEKAARLAILAAKARASDAAQLIARQGLHLHGAMGFTDECDIGLYLKRAINLAAMLGRAEDLRLQFIREERAA